MRNILVSGGLGFIGSNFINFVATNEHSINKIVNIDKVDYCSSHDNIDSSDKYIFIE